MPSLWLRKNKAGPLGNLSIGLGNYNFDSHNVQRFGERTLVIDFRGLSVCASPPYLVCFTAFPCVFHCIFFCVSLPFLLCFTAFPCVFHRLSVCASPPFRVCYTAFRSLTFRVRPLPCLVNSLPFSARHHCLSSVLSQRRVSAHSCSRDYPSGSQL